MATQTMRITRKGDNLWLWWGLAGLLGFVGGMTIKTTIEIVADLGHFTAVLDTIPPVVFGALLGAMLGSCTGLAQWLVLRRRLDGVGAWLPATFGATVLFWTLHNSGLLPFWITPWGLVVQGFAHGAIVGAMNGVAQAYALRSRVPSAWRWALISTVSWSLAGAIMHFLLDVLLASANVHGPFDILIASTLAALFSGVALQRLLRSAAV